MLLSLSVDNFRSFKNGFEFSMEATRLKNLKESNVAKVENIELLYSSILYGANASGKSNYIKSFAKMKAILKNSTSIEKAKQYPHEPFMLNTHTKKLPTKYEIEIILDKTKYRYGFEIGKDAKIQKEWLFYKNLKPYAQEVKLFDRIDKNIEVYSHYKDTKVLESKTRDEALFLVVTAEFNSEISKMIYDWFDKTQVISNIDTRHLETYSFEKLNDELYRDKIINIIKNADVGISDIISKKLTLDELEGKLKLPKEVIESFPKDIRENIKANGITKIDTVHMIYDEKDEFQGYEEFDLEFESDGTKKLLALSAPLVESLIQGNTIFIDELDNSLHLDLIEAIIKLYHDKDINQNNAQIIFSTHNTNLLNQEIFRRDQIWFVEKDIYGSSQLYSLVEYGKGKARDDLALEKNYNAGKFGAKPSIVYCGNLMARIIKKTKVEKKAVLIALEDTKSSKYYFQSLVKDSGLSGEVIFATHVGTNPSKVLEAITSTPRYKKDYEKQWIVIDKDDWSKSDFNGTIKQAKDLGVCCAFSNESYELWILLHFENLQRYTNRVDLNKKLKELFLENFKIEYSKANSDIYALIKSRQKDAIYNAKSLIKKCLIDNGEIKPFEQNPLTNIYELVECLDSIGSNANTDCECYPTNNLNY